ncbi:MAG: hypothetical protein LBT73_01670, partial [Tannerellaceae bacterium]|nr:hypothetical protein [Tannerellaceae bacterium]
MTEAIHPYIRYAQALIMLENDLSDCENIEDSHIADEIEKGLNVFRVQPKESFEGKESIKYDFVRKEKGDTKKGVFLSSSTLSTDKEARYIWKAANELIVELRKYPRKKNKKVDLTTS